MKTTDKRKALEQLLQGNPAQARALRPMTLDLDQFTIDELEQLRFYQEGRGDDKADLAELQHLFGRKLNLKPLESNTTFKP